MVISTSLSHVQVSSILDFLSCLPATFSEQPRGIATYMGSVLDTPASELQDHLDVSENIPWNQCLSSHSFLHQVNVTGILVLFQSVYSLLKASTSPRFIPISSAAASLTAFISLPAGYTCYGASKVAVNYVARKIHFENDWLSTHLLLLNLTAYTSFSLSLLPSRTRNCTDRYV